MTQRLIGGTTIGKIIGVSPYGGPAVAYEEIVNGWRAPETPIMRLGLSMEPVVRGLYITETGAKLAQHPGVLRSSKYEWMTASPDDLLAERDAGVEYKTAKLATLHKWGEPGTADVPEHYAAQCAWYMAATNRSEWDLGVLVAGDEFRVYRLTRDLELESMLVEAASKFWKDHVLPRRPPLADASGACADILKAKFPQSNGTLLPATPELARLVCDYREASAHAKAADALKGEARNRLIAAIGEADGVAGSCTNRLNKGRAKVDWEAVCFEAQVSRALIDKHTSRSPYRALKLSGGNSNE